MRGRGCMRVGLLTFCGFLAVAWLALLAVTVNSVEAMGVAAAGPVFFGDFGHPWRAQFGTDFGVHLLLIAAWMIYRAKTWIGGLVCGALAVLMGGVFTLAFLMVITLRARGDMALVLTGRAAGPSRPGRG